MKKIWSMILLSSLLWAGVSSAQERVVGYQTCSLRNFKARLDGKRYSVSAMHFGVVNEEGLLSGKLQFDSVVDLSSGAKLGNQILDSGRILIEESRTIAEFGSTVKVTNLVELGKSAHLTSCLTKQSFKILDRRLLTFSKARSLFEILRANLN